MAKTYLSSLELPPALVEEKFCLEQKRTCYNGIYPFKIFPDKELERIEFSPITIFYGGNGSGKTTLLNIIAEMAKVYRHSAFSAGKLPIAKKSEKVYPLSCSGALSNNVGLADLLKLAASRDFSQMTMDVTLKVKLKCGIGKTLKFKDIKISELMEPSVAAAWVDLIANELVI